VVDVAHFNLLDKARRRYRSDRAKHPHVAALVPGGGEVKANGMLRVVLPLTDGSVVTYIAAPRVEWVLGFESYETPGRLEMEITESDRAKAALDVLLNVMADAERRIAKPQSDIAN
jgi:hypothetical protein